MDQFIEEARVEFQGPRECIGNLWAPNLRRVKEREEEREGEGEGDREGGRGRERRVKKISPVVRGNCPLEQA